MAETTVDLLRTELAGTTFTEEAAEKMTGVVPMLFPGNRGYIVRVSGAADDDACPFRISVYTADHALWRGYINIREAQYPAAS